MLKCRLHVSSDVANVCQMFTQWWHWIIGVGFTVNLASWKDGDIFPHFTQCQVLCRRPCHYFPSLFCNSDVDLFKFFQLNPVPKKSGMGVNSSNVDKRTWLIPCRCVSELCEGTLCCPHWREKGVCMGKVQWITSKKHQRPSTAGSVCLSGVLEQRKEANQCTYLSLSGGNGDMQSQNCMLVILKAEITITKKSLPQKKYIHSRFILESNPTQ